MKKLLVPTLLAVVALAPAPASGGVLDQQQTNTSASATPVVGFNMAQSFTPNLSGVLDRVDLFLGENGTLPTPLHLAIHAVAGGVPSGPALANEDIPASSIPALATPDWVQVDLSPTAPVTSGTPLAIVITTDEGGVNGFYHWFGQDPGNYLGGTGFTGGNPTWNASTMDFAFRTYVASTVSAVKIRSGSATRTSSGVLLRWRTASEIDTLGYYVYRQVKEKRIQVSPRLIMAKGGGLYSFLDRRAPRAKTLRYWIKAVDLDGSSRWHRVNLR